MNNKMIKGSIAGATGVALLMGGYGTYALWSDSTDLPASSVSSGVLTIAAAPSDVVWADENEGEWLEGDAIVPGDVVSRTQTFDIEGTGANLAGTITFVEEALDTDSATDNVTVDVVVTSDDPDTIVVPDTSPTAGPNDFTFDDPFGATTLTTVVTYTFDGSTETGATGDTDQDETWTLPASTFTISQN